MSSLKPRGPRPMPPGETAQSIGPPDAIKHHTVSHCLQLTWPDGQSVRLDTRQLREHCQCSSCRAMALQDWSRPTGTVDLRRVELFGVAGLQCFFTDDHERGVFPWQYLFELGQTIGITE